MPSTREYFHFFGLDHEKLARAKPDALVMHPGPMNRGVEIASTVADHSRAVIRDQVEMGVAVRMAVLEALAAHLPTLAETPHEQDDRKAEDHRQSDRLHQRPPDRSGFQSRRAGRPARARTASSPISAAICGATRRKARPSSTARATFWLPA